jgi:nicotinic acid phosphoribosyltransferase
LDDDSTLADCDMAVYATKIYDGIMTDLYKIKYAQVLDVNTVVNFDAIWYKKVLNFMSGYYLLAKTEEYQEYLKLKAEYPKTISILESNQRYYKDVLETVKIIDNSMLADLADAVKCPATEDRT